MCTGFFTPNPPHCGTKIVSKTTSGFLREAHQLKVSLIPDIKRPLRTKKMPRSNAQKFQAGRSCSGSVRKTLFIFVVVPFFSPPGSTSHVPDPFSVRFIFGKAGRTIWYLAAAATPFPHLRGCCCLSLFMRLPLLAEESRAQSSAARGN